MVLVSYANSCDKNCYKNLTKKIINKNKKKNVLEKHLQNVIWRPG